MNRWRQHVAGTLLCILPASVFAFSFHGSKLQSLLPFLFIAVIAFVAERFGSAAGIIGTLGAAAIFAGFLFKPIWSLAISDSTQRSNLIWMVIIGIIVSELLGVLPTSPSHHRRKDVSGV